MLWTAVTVTDGGSYLTWNPCLYFKTSKLKPKVCSSNFAGICLRKLFAFSVTRKPQNFRAENDIRVPGLQPWQGRNQEAAGFLFTLHNLANKGRCSCFVALLMTSPLRISYTDFDKKMPCFSLCKRARLFNKLNVAPKWLHFQLVHCSAIILPTSQDQGRRWSVQIPSGPQSGV